MKLIASWGSSGAGKTTIALAVAATLTQRKKDVLVVGMDTRTPMLPVYLPNAKLDRTNSLGGVFEQTISEAALKDKMIPHPQSDRLYFMGLASEEVPGITYPIPNQASVQRLFDVLRQSPFAYCIIDCDSTAVLDPITLLALERSEVVLRSITPDVRGHEGMHSQLRWMSNNDTFRSERHIPILNPIYPHTPVTEMKALEGTEPIVMPWARQVAERQLAGRLLTRFDEPKAADFERRIYSLVDRIEEVAYG